MNTQSIPKTVVVPLAVSGVLFFVGAVLHPHAPSATNMAQVAYDQTGQTVWWPAHALLLGSYLVFATTILRISRRVQVPASIQKVLDFAIPAAWICVAAMLAHLLLPIGRASVVDSHHGWALWVKDVAEAADALWALVLGVVAWSFGRAGLLGNRVTAVAGVAGAIGFAVFSIVVPLTDTVFPISFTRSLLPIIPVFAVLIAAWAIGTGLMALRRPRMVSAVQPAP